MRVGELIRQLSLLPLDLEVKTEGDESLYLNEPRPRIEYYREYGEGPDTPTYDTPTAKFYQEKQWVELALVPVVLL
jgi:hypothetical protein